MLNVNKKKKLIQLLLLSFQKISAFLNPGSSPVNGMDITVLVILGKYFNPVDQIQVKKLIKTQGIRYRINHTHLIFVAPS